MTRRLPPSLLTSEAFVAWLGLYGAPRGPNTIIGQLSYFRAACALAVESGWLERAPSWRRLRPRRARPAAVRHLTRAEVARLLADLRLRATTFRDFRSRRLYALVATVCYTGVRRDEALFLRVADCDLVRGVIWVAPHHKRTLKTAESEAPVPIPPDLAPILSAWLPTVDGEWAFPGVKGNGPWHGGAPGRRPIDALREAVARACGVQGAQWKWLRTSLGTHGVLAFGLSQDQMRRVLRHTTNETGRRHYLESDLEDLRAIGAMIRY